MRHKVGPRTQIDSSLCGMYFCNVWKEGTWTIHEKETATFLRHRPIRKGTRSNKQWRVRPIEPSHDGSALKVTKKKHFAWRGLYGARQISESSVQAYKILRELKTFKARKITNARENSYAAHMLLGETVMSGY